MERENSNKETQNADLRSEIEEMQSELLVARQEEEKYKAINQDIVKENRDLKSLSKDRERMNERLADYEREIEELNER